MLRLRFRRSPRGVETSSATTGPERERLPGEPPDDEVPAQAGPTSLSETGVSQEPLVSVEGVERVYEGAAPVRALQGVDLRILPGRIVAVMGRSGSGKTTLLNIIGGLDRPSAGRVVFKGRDITRMKEGELTLLRRRDLGFIFQSFALMHLLSAFENVELAMKIAGTPASQRSSRVWECLRMVGIEGRARHRVNELSGGEQQRVAVARAIALRPSLVLADEPTGEVDSDTATRILELFRELVRVFNLTFCLATHDPVVASLADESYLLKDGLLYEREERS